MRKFQTVDSAHKFRRFGLRTLFALMTAFAFVALAARWLISVGMQPALVGMLTIPLTVGSVAGIAISVNRNQSTLLGSMLGGVLATMVCPGSYIFFLYMNGMNGVRDLSGLWFVLGFAMGISALIAATVGVLREGIKTSRKLRRFRRTNQGVGEVSPPRPHTT